MKLDNYFFERMSKDKLQDFYKLFKTRGKDISLTHFEKKYRTTWTGKEYLGVIAYDLKRNPVGHICILPTLIEKDGKEYISGQICDIVVHPSHKRKGVFEQLIIEGIEIAKEEGLCFLYVCPNVNADPIFKKWGWLNVDNYKIYTFKTKCFPINKIANKFHLLQFQDLYIKGMLWILSKHKKKAFKNSVIETGIGGMIRSQDYIKYKNYTYNYISVINGFKIWWKIDDGLSIGDIERFEPSQLPKLFKTIRFLCFILGFHNFKIVTTNNTFIDNLLKDLYPSEKGNNVYFWDISSGIDFSKIKFMQADLNTF